MNGRLPELKVTKVYIGYTYLVHVFLYFYCMTEKFKFVFSEIKEINKRQTIVRTWWHQHWRLEQSDKFVHKVKKNIWLFQHLVTQ